jgi:flagellar biosynthesis GTPase FlhF
MNEMLSVVNDQTHPIIAIKYDNEIAPKVIEVVQMRNDAQIQRDATAHNMELAEAARIATLEANEKAVKAKQKVDRLKIEDDDRKTIRERAKNDRERAKNDRERAKNDRERAKHQREAEQAEREAAEAKRLAEVARVAAEQVDPVRVQALYDELTPQARSDTFWELIGTLQWHNFTDGGMNKTTVNNVIGKFAPLHRRLFKEFYDQNFKILKDILLADDMFDRNGIIGMQAQSKIISHIIALGRDQFRTLSEDLVILQFIIEAGECQSLDSMLPEDLKI